MNLKEHYSEADLLETYYTQPGESLPVMMHLADCAECAARYERVERKVRGLAACGHEEKPDTFWARQRHLVMRRVAKESPRASAARTTSVAAAAALVLVLGGVATWNQFDEAPVSEPVVRTATQDLTRTATVTGPTEDATDPWASDELDEYGSMVEWETWVETGDQSL
jgi:anti-sigma factor RsiW